MTTSSQKATENLPRSAYVPHPHVYMEITGESRAKQSMRDECDINVIMAQYHKTGMLAHVNQYEGNYTDLPMAIDYHSMLNQAQDALDAFESLPSDIRTMFHNEPEEFLAFVQDPSNREEMIDLGLAHADPADTPAEVEQEKPPAASEAPPAAPPKEENS